MQAVVIEGLSVSIEDTTVLDDITVSLPAGKIIGLLGPSGSGKTTLMRAIVGRLRPAKGSLTVLEKPAGSPSLRAEIGYVTQAPSVYKDITVLENLEYFAAIVGAAKVRAEEVVDQVGLGGHEHQIAGSLSGGQLSRVSLAAALLGEPKLLVLDEPTVGIDPVLRRDLWQQFRQLAEKGVTLLVSSHVMDEASHCDELLLLRDGKVLAYDTQAKLQEQTHTKDIEAAFLALVEGTS
jgi:ABC-2 type transport system ATP-binding protein